MQIIEISIALIMSALLYELLLRKETFFQWNRFYLLLTAALSCLLPLLKIKWSREEAPYFQQTVSEGYQTTQAVIFQMTTKSIVTPTFIISDLLLSIFMIGFLIKIGLFFSKLYRLRQWISQGETSTVQGIIYVTPKNELPVSSFFNYLFWGKNEKIDPYILAHELVHIRQKHSFDVLFIEILVALQWFNPCIYYFKKRLREVHEFIADESVVRSTGERYQYAAMLVAEAERTQKLPLSVLNTFSSFIQLRLIMLTNHRSLRWKKAKYLLVFPLIFSFFMLFSCQMMAKISPSFQSVETAISTIAAQPILVPKTTHLPEITISQPTEKQRFILYWSDFQMEFLNHQPNEYSATISVPINSIKRLHYSRGIYFWNGKALDKNIAFALTHKNVTTNVSNVWRRIIAMFCLIFSKT
jgi:beta-lactamase regulating signal transducer with metallopeptidase domain